MSSSELDQPTSRGRYPKGIARRQEILDRAIEVFATRGARRTSLRAIAQEVGVTHAALTHYFGSLDELLVAVYRAAAPADDDSPSVDEKTPAETMRLAAAENREIPGMVQLYSSLVSDALGDDHPAAQAFITERFARLRRDLGDRVRRLQEAGRIRDDLDASLVAALVIAASDGLQDQWLLDPSVDHEQALALLDRLLAPPG